MLVSKCPATGTVAGTAMAYCAGNWWSYDTPGTIASKMTYKKGQGAAPRPPSSRFPLDPGVDP